MPKGIPKNKEKVKDTVSFIKRANEVHGDRFDYSKTVYARSNLKVIITCNEHGDFTQTPNNHLSGLCGCKRCVPKGLPMDKDYWVEKFVSVHGDAYNYDKFEPKGAFTKSVVTCNKTGKDFQISPDGHGNGKKGCPCCRYEKSRAALIISEEDANIRLQEKHGDKLQIKSGYTKFTDKCEISCKHHGSFYQAPVVAEATTYGCPSCFEDAPKRGGFYNDSYLCQEYERLSSDLNNIYLLDFMDGTYKIGIAKNVKARRKMVEKEYRTCKVVFQKQASTVAVFMVEEHLHEIFDRLRHKPDVSFAGETEVFSLTKEQVDFVKSYTESVLGRLSCHIQHGKM